MSGSGNTYMTVNKLVICSVGNLFLANITEARTGGGQAPGPVYNEKR